MGDVKTSGFTLSFQHLSWDLANVNTQKNMFDPYIIISLAGPNGNDSICLVYFQKPMKLKALKTLPCILVYVWL